MSAFTVPPDPFPMSVSITIDEARSSGRFGLDRQLKSVYDGRQDRGGPKDDGEEKQISGAWGEFVVHKGLGLPWNMGIDTFSTVADVGDMEEVRTRPRDGDEIVLRSDDFKLPKLIRRFWLVTRRPPIFLIQGWLIPKEVHKFFDPETPFHLRPRPCILSRRDAQNIWRWYFPNDHIQRWMPAIPGSKILVPNQQLLPIQIQPISETNDSF